MSAGTLVQTVDVLGDEREIGVALTPRREHLVRPIRTAGRNPLAPPVVPFPDESRIAREGFRSGELLGTMLFPQPVRAAEGRHPAGGRDASAGQHRDARVWRQMLGEQIDVLVHINKDPSRTNCGLLSSQSVNT